MCVSKTYAMNFASGHDVTVIVCLLQDQDAEQFSKRVNDSGGNFELFVYEDAGHAFLTAESHRDSKLDLLRAWICSPAL